MDHYTPLKIPNRKPMMPTKTLDIIFRRRYVKNTQYYYTNRKISEKERSYILDRKPFRVPNTSKIISFAKYNEKKVKATQQSALKMKAIDKDNMNLALRKNIAPRLFVPEPVDDVKDVTSIHPEFYTVIEGRPIRQFDDIKQYILDIRNTAMKTQEVGYNNDMRFRMAKDMDDETKIYQAINLKYKKHIKDFETYLREDHQSVRNKVAKIEKVVAQLATKVLEQNAIAVQTKTLSNLVLKNEDTRNVLKYYKQFLTQLAPIPWRERYDKDFNKPTEIVEPSIGFVGLNKIVENAKAELAVQEKPLLYFKDPKEISNIFRVMELQCRDYLVHLSTRFDIRALLKEKVDKLSAIMKEEESHFQYFIDWFEDKIEREISRAREVVQIFYRLLNGQYFECVAGAEALKLGICVGFLYDSLFGDTQDVYQNLVDPFRVIEQLYEDLSMDLDRLKPSLVNKAKKEFFAEDRKMMKLAYLAEMELKRFEELTRNLKKAFDPPYKPVRGKKTAHKLDTESETHKEIQSQVSGEVLRPDLKEALYLFTEWCGSKDNLDVSKYLYDYTNFIKPILDEIENEDF